MDYMYQYHNVSILQMTTVLCGLGESYLYVHLLDARQETDQFNGLKSALYVNNGSS